MFSQKKPYSAVTVTVERLTSEQFEEDDLSGIPDLIEVIKLQASGPAEAARALRKKLKYGSVHRQLRALVLLDGLIQNGGPRFQRTFIDEPLLERLRVCGTSDLSDPDVKKKCSELFRGWAAEYKSTPGLERVAMLYRELPRRKQVVTQDRSKVLRETEQDPFRDSEDEAEQPQSPTSQASSSRQPISFPQPTQTIQSFSHVKSASGSGSGSGAGSLFSSSSKDKKKKDKDKSKRKHKPFNLEAEKDSMKVAIAESSIAATNLTNALQSINRERERISENPAAVKQFEICKRLRRKILRYIHHVEDEQWLGGLLHANDELVVSLMTYEQLDRSIDADSDSEDEAAEQAHLYRMATEKHKQAMSPSSPSSPVPEMATLSINPSPPPRPAPPPRPSAASKPTVAVRPASPPDSEEEDDYADEDENDPFADRNAVVTPKVERGQPNW
ncbi:hypothetical protein M426DRAFT_316086 [Hypoxylon sp. CI-4A]|nr:hypothetical protein M426DRAFT_316086 [Hypoxylon sp. CI-4A]